jgi:hypothetical protein
MFIFFLAKNPGRALLAAFTLLGLALPLSAQRATCPPQIFSTFQDKPLLNNSGTVRDRSHDASTGLSGVIADNTLCPSLVRGFNGS